MSTKVKSAKSAPSCEVKANVDVVAIYPKADGYDSVGITLTVEEARKLARNLLVLTEDFEAEGNVILTGMKKTKKLSVLRRVPVAKADSAAAK